MYVSFIDYSAAFDSVSHKFIDKALKAAGASDIQKPCSIQSNLPGSIRDDKSAKHGRH